MATRALTMDRGVLLCLLNHQHSMEADDAKPSERQGQWGVAVDWRCGRCGTVRRDVYNRFSYQLVSRTYEHSEAYRNGRASFNSIPSAADIRAILFGGDLAKVREARKARGTEGTRVQGEVG